MGLSPDLKQRLNNIMTGAVAAFKSGRTNEKYDFTPAAKALANEAFTLGYNAKLSPEEAKAVTTEVVKDKKAK